MITVDNRLTVKEYLIAILNSASVGIILTALLKYIANRIKIRGTSRGEIAARVFKFEKLINHEIEAFKFKYKQSRISVFAVKNGGASLEPGVRKKVSVGFETTTDLAPIMEDFQEYPIDPSYQELLFKALQNGRKSFAVKSLPDSTTKKLYESMGVVHDEIYFLDVRGSQNGSSKFKEIWFLGIQNTHIPQYPLSYQLDGEVLINKLRKYLKMQPR